MWEGLHLQIQEQYEITDPVHDAAKNITLLILQFLSIALCAQKVLFQIIINVKWQLIFPLNYRIEHLFFKEFN